MIISSNDLCNGQYTDIMGTIMFCNIDWGYSELMSNWEQYGFVCKDTTIGEIFKVKELGVVNNNTFSLLCVGGISLICNIKKEKKFFELYDNLFTDLNEFITWLQSDYAKEWFLVHEIYIQCISVNDGTIMGSLLEAHLDTQRQEFFKEIKNPQKVYKAYIKEKNLGGFIVIINGVNAFLPGSLASANKIIDFNTLIGKTINVMFEDYIKEGDTFIVSNKKYIQYILPEKIKELKFDRTYTGEITGTSKFGIFIEFNDLFTGLLHISEMIDETRNKFITGQYLPGDSITFYIKEIAKDNRIILSDTESLQQNVSIEQFKEAFENKVITGQIISMKHYGYFVKFNVQDTIFIGLLYIKDAIYKNVFRIGDIVECFVNRVETEAKKIYLNQNKSN